MQKINFGIKQNKSNYFETMESFYCSFSGASILLQQKLNDNLFSTRSSLMEIEEAGEVHGTWGEGNRMITSDPEDINACKVTFYPCDLSSDGDY